MKATFHSTVTTVSCLCAALIVVFTTSPAAAQDADTGPEEETVSEEGDDEAARDAEATEQDDEEGPVESDKDSKKKDSSDGKWGGRLRDHAKQGFFNLLIGTGYFLVAPYDKDDPEKRCEISEDDPNEGEPLCGGRVGWHFDMLLGYGLKPGFELFLMFRLGLERPDSESLLNQPKTRQLGMGIKVYTPKDGLFKLGFGVAPLFDFSSRGGTVGVRNDFVLHVPIQALFDVLPWLGAYAQVAPNLSFIAEFRVEFTGGIGLQGRFP